MRMFLIAAAIAMMAPMALAQPAPARPSTTPPAATAPFEQREAWCQQYAAWLIARDPTMPLLNDVRPTQRFEVEFNSCKLDPQRYELETRAEANTNIRVS